MNMDDTYTFFDWWPNMEFIAVPPGKVIRGYDLQGVTWIHPQDGAARDGVAHEPDTGAVPFDADGAVLTTTLRVGRETYRALICPLLSHDYEPCRGCANEFYRPFLPYRYAPKPAYGRACLDCSRREWLGDKYKPAAPGEPDIGQEW